MIIDIQKILSEGVSLATWFVDAFYYLTMVNPNLTQEQKYGNWGQNPNYYDVSTADDFYLNGFYSFNFADSSKQTINPYHEYYNEAYLNITTLPTVSFEDFVFLNSIITYQQSETLKATNTTSSTIVPNYLDLGYVIDSTFDPTDLTTSTVISWYWWAIMSALILFVLLLIIAVPLLFKKNQEWH